MRMKDFKKLDKAGTNVRASGLKNFHFVNKNIVAQWRSMRPMRLLV
jgi:hypothetical protein